MPGGPTRGGSGNPAAARSTNSCHPPVAGGAGGDQRVDLRSRQPCLGENLDAVLAEPWRQAANVGLGAAEARRNVRHADPALVRVVEFLPESGRGELPVMQ